MHLGFLYALADPPLHIISSSISILTNAQHNFIMIKKWKTIQIGSDNYQLVWYYIDYLLSMSMLEAPFTVAVYRIRSTICTCSKPRDVPVFYTFNSIVHWSLNPFLRSHSGKPSFHPFSEALPIKVHNKCRFHINWYQNRYTQRLYYSPTFFKRIDPFNDRSFSDAMYENSYQSFISHRFWFIQLHIISQHNSPITI